MSFGWQNKLSNMCVYIARRAVILIIEPQNPFCSENAKGVKERVMERFMTYILSK